MTKIQLRRGTGTQWRDANPTLASGEPGYETDTGRQKIGDGTLKWSALPYFVDEARQLRRSPVVNEAGLGRWWALCARASTDSVRAVFLGSSTSAGSGASSAEHRWVNRWMRHLQGAYPSGTAPSTVRSLSAGTNSPSSEPGLHGLNGANAANNSATYCSAAHLYGIGVVDPVLVVHMIGSNDSVAGTYFVAVDQYKRNIEAAIDAMGNQRCHLLVHSFRRFSTAVSVKEWAAYGNALREIADARGNVAFVDLSGEFEEAYRQGNPARLISVDDVHPSDAGHALLADLAARRLGLGTVGVPERSSRSDAPGQLKGTGSPQGKVAAPIGSTYTDAEATSGAVQWVKATGAGDTGWQVLHADTGWRSMTVPQGFALAPEAGSHVLRRVGERVSVRFRLSATTDLAGSSLDARLDLMELPAGFLAPGRDCVTTAYVRQPLRAAAAGTLSSRSTISLEVLPGAGTQTWAAGDLVVGQVEWTTDSDWPDQLPGKPV